MDQTNPATAGPNRDGSRSLAPESRIGNLVNGVVAAGLMYLGQWLGELDLTGLPDAIEPLAVAAAATLAGLAASYVKKNR
jgi:hypothetical protein